MRLIISCLTTCVLLAHTLVAAATDRKRSSMEFHTASMIAAQLGHYWDANQQSLPLSLTNVFQGGSSDELLLRWEKVFDEFGADRGFENHLLEKYVLLDPPVLMENIRMGHMVVIAHEPYVNENDELWRAVVKIIPSGDFRGFTYKDEDVQRWLAKDGRTLPEPPKLAPLPRPVLVFDPSEEELKRLNDEAFYKLYPEERPGTTISPPGERLTLPRNLTHANTNAVIAATTPGPVGRSGLGWRLGVALAGVGLIAFLLLRARRRV